MVFPNTAHKATEAAVITLFCQRCTLSNLLHNTLLSLFVSINWKNTNPYHFVLKCLLFHNRKAWRCCKIHETSSYSEWIKMNVNVVFRSYDFHSVKGLKFVSFVRTSLISSHYICLCGSNDFARSPKRSQQISRHFLSNLKGINHLPGFSVDMPFLLILLLLLLLLLFSLYYHYHHH